MVKVKFESIYNELRKEILEGIYNDTMLLPTEMSLVERFASSRNTIRRAIQQLNDEGFVYSVKGRGVVILEHAKVDQMFFRMGNFQGLKALRSEDKVHTETIVNKFEEITVSEKLANEISFLYGERAYYIERIRKINGKAMMYDCSYFKKNIVQKLNPIIAQGSIYEYIDNNMDFRIAASKTIMKVETATKKDLSLLDLGGNNCVGEMENIVYTDMGKLFEHTRIRYIPHEYALVTFSQRRKEGTNIETSSTPIT
ncbi:GntR family transcriptional regulator [Enterococcus faecium]|uniref:GntR family transcriptional regulator n=1 Tax=Enterococcus TaxID=1350 RepID=UPI000A3326A7|nr:GntR family transcriptional regulator [Enterococcus faecium]OTN78287.1 hypothetical protein A5826_002139 [Enterococcus faecium]